MNNKVGNSSPLQIWEVSPFGVNMALVPLSRTARKLPWLYGAEDDSLGFVVPTDCTVT